MIKSGLFEKCKIDLTAKSCQYYILYVKAKKEKSYDSINICKNLNKKHNPFLWKTLLWEN